MQTTLPTRPPRPLSARGLALVLLPLTPCLLLTPWLEAQERSDFAEVEVRSPLEIRDEHVLAQGRLTLPATTPETVDEGVTRLRFSFLWSNSFSWTQDQPGEHPEVRSFLIDGETRTFDLTVTHGLGASFDLSARLPLRWRGGGSLDGLIDAWHRAVGFLGVNDGDRPQFLQDAFRVEGMTTDHGSFSWNDSTGLGLGDAEVAGRYTFHQGRSAFAVVGRLSLPTATSPYEGGIGAGLQLVARRPLTARTDFFAGVGGTIEGNTDVEGVGYEPARAHGFAALTWRPWRRLALSLETNIASRLVRNIDHYPGLHWLLDGGFKLSLSPSAVLEAGFTENIKSQLCTPDFALYFAVSARP